MIERSFKPYCKPTLLTAKYNIYTLHVTTLLHPGVNSTGCLTWCFYCVHPILVTATTTTTTIICSSQVLTFRVDITHTHTYNGRLQMNSGDSVFMYILDQSSKQNIGMWTGKFSFTILFQIKWIVLIWSVNLLQRKSLSAWCKCGC